MENQESESKKNQVNRRDYFREYNRRNKQKLKMISLMGGVGKLIAEQKSLTAEIVDKTEVMRKEQIKLEIKLNQIKKFLNIK